MESNAEGRGDQQNDIKVEHKFYGTQQEYDIEVATFEKSNLWLKDTNTEEQLRSESGLLGASQTSKVEKCIYKNTICTHKTIAQFKDCKLMNDLNSLNSEYAFLFQNPDIEQGSHPKSLNRFFKIYEIQKRKDGISKPFLCIISSFDQQKVSLNQFLKSLINLKRLPLTLIFFIIKSLAESLQYLHQNQLSHGNVCLNNIFIKQDILDKFELSQDQISLSDAGIHYLFRGSQNKEITTEKVEDQDFHIQNELNPVLRSGVNFLAPELKNKIRDNQFNPDYKSDIYQLGICMLCMFNIPQIKDILSYLKKPEKIQESLIKQKIVELKLNVNEKKQKDIIQFLKGMLESNPKDRLSSKEVFKQSKRLFKQFQLSKQEDKLTYENYQLLPLMLKNDLKLKNIEFCEKFDRQLEQKKENAMVSFKRITNDLQVGKMKQMTKHQLTRETIKVVDNLIEDTQQLTVLIQRENISQITNNQERQSLYYEIKFMNQLSPSIDQTISITIIIERNQLVRASLADYTSNKQNEDSQNQVSDFIFDNSSEIKTCAFLNNEYFLTLDNQLRLRVWNVCKKDHFVSRREQGFDSSLVRLVNISNKYCVIYDNQVLRLFLIIEDHLAENPYPFLHREHELEIRGTNYSIKSVMPVPDTEESLFLVFRSDHQLDAYNSVSRQLIQTISLESLPEISRMSREWKENLFFTSKDQTSDIILDYNSTMPSSNKNPITNPSHSIKPSLCERIFQFFSKQRIPATSPIHKNNKKGTEQARLLYQDKSLLIPDISVGFILSKKYLYRFSLRGLFSDISNQQSQQYSLPCTGLYESGSFHPKDKNIFIFITDRKEIILFKYTNNQVLKRIYSQWPLRSMLVIPFENEHYLVLSDTIQNTIFKLSIPASSVMVDFVRKSGVKELIIFPKSLYSVQKPPQTSPNKSQIQQNCKNNYLICANKLSYKLLI